MAIQDISNLPISASFQNLLQVSGSEIGTATGSAVTSLDITASLATNAVSATSASRATSAASADLATTASYVAASNVDGTVATATSASHAVNADIAITASHVTTVVNSASFASTASYVETAQTASYIAGANVDGQVASALSASHAVQADNAIEADQEDTVQIPARAAEALSKGDPVYISGYNSGQERIEISKADASDSAKMPVVGLAIADVSQNTNTHVIAVGSLTDVDTSTGLVSPAVGDTLYAAVGGGYTNVKPTGSANLIQNVGKIGRVNTNNGEIAVSAILRTNDLPNIQENYLWVGNSNDVPTATDKDALTVGTASLALDMPSDTNLNINQITASFASFTSASIGYIESITGSAKIIGDAYIIVNNNTPTERYAGLVVQDSGSSNNTASMEFDGQTNDWFYEYTDDGGATAEHGIVMFGPGYNTKGSPTYNANNTILKGTGDHHIADSNITDDGTNVNIDGNLIATGSHILQNTALTPSTILQVKDDNNNIIQVDNDALAAITGFNVIFDGNTKADGNLEITGDTLFTASQADQAQTASYVAGGNVDGAVATANTASYVAAANIDGTVANATSASYATTASYAQNVEGLIQTGSNITMSFDNGVGTVIGTAAKPVTETTMSIDTGSMVVGSSVLVYYSASVEPEIEGGATIDKKLGSFDEDALNILTFVSTGDSGNVVETIAGVDVEGIVTNSTDTYTSNAKVQHLVSLTQAEYDAIGTKNDNTLYIII
jgi:hypothetical protein